MEKISKESVLHQLMREHPSAIKVFDSYGMGCKSCGGAKLETVEWAATMHGLDTAEFLKRLNDEASREGAKGK
ncbi:MAG: DUF1858 domain-containing protein [Nitrospinae bacterium]|nr:DUF1858 domain-containing protein [Nitrospinota bacterium]